MVDVHIQHPDGSSRDLEGREGESIMQLATRHAIPGIIGECGGEMSCATCHVHVDAQWRSKLRSPSEDETDLVEMSDDYTEDSRLSCQIKLRPEINGIVVSTLPGMV